MARLGKRRKGKRRPQGRVDTNDLFRQAYLAHLDERFDEAEGLYKTILRHDPRHTDALNMLGALRQALGRFDSAVKPARKAVKLKPDSADYLVNLGTALRGTGDFPAAENALRRALALVPHHGPALFNLGVLLLDMGKTSAAIETLKTLTRHHPSMTAAHEQLARALEEDGQWQRATDVLSALAEKSHHPAPLYNNIGNIYSRNHHLHEARIWYERAAAADPDLAAAHVNLSWTCKEHGDVAADIACLRAYLARHPQDARTHSDLLFSLNYDPGLSPADLYREAGEWGRLHGGTARRPARQERPDDAPLRVGFLSPDLRSHPVGTFLLPLLAALDPAQIEVFCYAELPPDREDHISAAIQEHCAAWRRTAGLDAAAAAAMIRADELDLLIDLAGHSANNRLDVMAQRPAPLQATWLGYVNTTGLGAIDYRITDAVTDPPGAEAINHERLLRLPGPFFCYQPPPEAEGLDPGPLPALENGHITFASFNNLAKINDQVMALWGEIMAAVAGARLLFVAAPLADSHIRETILARLDQHGIDRARVTTAAGLSMREYLARHREVDIGLDPFPHNGHTITCHALWMGVPCVALRGDRYAARMGASVLTAAGLPELIAETPREYVDKTITLAQDTARLATLRATMRERLTAAPICDAPAFAAAFTGCLRAAARQAGQAD